MKIRRFCIAAGILIAAFAMAWLLLPKPPLLEGIQFSPRVFDRHGVLLRIALTPDQKYRVFTPLNEVAQDAVSATLAYEDRFYTRHAGVNPAAVARCAWNFLLGRSRAGASTITMQVARLRFGIHCRTFAGKLAQIVRALELERHYSKSQILEAYFNLAPYGGNIEGIGTASLLYLHKSPAALSRYEATMLSVIPQSPRRRAPRAGESNAALISAQRRLVSRDEAADSAATFTPPSGAAHPFLAPHFTTEILNEEPRRMDNTTTLDADLQRLVERQLKVCVEANRGSGIENAAALLVDFRAMEVLAQVGSADFSDEKILGQIDGTRRPRSPGSTLKPFVYALAMEQGLIHPLTMLKDAPQSFGGYNPENFDREFIGPISAADALSRSRNVPAVELASRLVHPNLYDLLRSANVPLPHEEKFYGLALPLGDAEITMDSLVRLYCVLANGGQMRPLRRTKSRGTGTAARLLSTESAFLTLEMLGRASRPGGSEPTAAESVFWKTGTSHGFHDAWSVAVFDRYVLAVWIGNFDGCSNPAFVGRTAAAPLLFQIVDALRAHGHTKPSPHEPPAGADLTRIELCAVSGGLPTAACPHRVQGWFIPGVSPIAPCSVHREVLVDEQTGLRISHPDGLRAVRREVYEFWPADLMTLFEKAGLARRLPPPFLPEEDAETRDRKGNPPRIVSPRMGLQYSVAAADSVSRGMALRAEADVDAQKLFWFANKTFLGSANARETLYWKPAAGTYRLLALDDHGRSDMRTVQFVASQGN
ncbi:MAG: penicillin-binding protein [Chthoniobacter sp.]|jgi:penicillin-binding protein 1C|nr:penicillin-binding protein [Chthoniobacter sp.]